VTCKTGFGLDYWIYWHPIHTTQNYRQLQRHRWSTHLQFTVTHALGFSVVASRILATDFTTVSLSLQITHEVFFALPNSFLLLILQLPIPKARLNSISLLPGSYHGRLASRISTLFLSTEFLFTTTLHGPRIRRGKVCLQLRCIVTEVTWLLFAYSLPRESVYRVVA
jgi:hypothetical protein